MKKILFVCAVAAIALSSCGSQSNAKANQQSAEVKSATKAACCSQETAATPTTATKADSSCTASCGAKKSCCDKAEN